MGCFDNPFSDHISRTNTTDLGGENYQTAAKGDMSMGTYLQHFPAPYFDTLGYDENGQMTGRTGAPEQRAAIFARMNAARPQINQASDQATKQAFAAAANPGFAAAANLANRSINGDYLNGSPQLDAALGRVRAAGNREAADNSANLRDSFARNGMSFGTANQQAQQSNQALATARMNDSETQARTQNYLAERANQNAGVGQLNEAVSSPLNYLSQVSAAQLLPLAQQGNIVTGLTPGQQRNVDRIEKEGAMRSFTSTVGAL